MEIITEAKKHNEICETFINTPHSIFSELPKDLKTSINKNTSCMFFKKGETIYKEGDEPKGLTCLVTGKVKIYKEGIGGKKQIVRMAKPVGFIGYRAFFAREIHIASAEALEDSIICTIKSQIIRSIVSTSADTAMLIIQALATDLGFSHRRTVTLTQKHIRARLAEALLVLIETYGLESDNKTLKVYITREDLSNLSNMTTANAIRTLSSFSSEGIVKLIGKKIIITDMDKLIATNNEEK